MNTLPPLGCRAHRAIVVSLLVLGGAAVSPAQPGRDLRPPDIKVPGGRPVQPQPEPARPQPKPVEPNREPARPEDTDYFQGRVAAEPSASGGETTGWVVIYRDGNTDRRQEILFADGLKADEYRGTSARLFGRFMDIRYRERGTVRVFRVSRVNILPSGN